MNSSHAVQELKTSDDGTEVQVTCGSTEFGSSDGRGNRYSLSGPLRKSLWKRPRRLVKAMVQGLSVLIALPFAAASMFGRISPCFQAFAHMFALVPGLPGDYLRVAYYFLTLRKCSLQSRVSFGSFFAQSSCAVGKGVYVGAYCVLGTCDIGDRTQIASHVQIVGGRYQHRRAEDGRIMGADENEFTQVTIGKDCWIGASAIVMADVGAKSTVGAGSIVIHPVPMGVVAVGNPARVREYKPVQ